MTYELLLVEVEVPNEIEEVFCEILIKLLYNPFCYLFRSTILVFNQNPFILCVQFINNYIYASEQQVLKLKYLSFEILDLVRKDV